MNMENNRKPEEQLEDITEPHLHDVLCGRGNFVNHHPGNKNFRKIVRKYKKAYVTSRVHGGSVKGCHKDKAVYSKSIYSEIRALKPPGRFLKQDPKTKLWSDIGERKALDKTRQALREGAPELLKTIFSEEVTDLAGGRADVDGPDAIGGLDLGATSRAPVGVHPIMGGGPRMEHDIMSLLRPNLGSSLAAALAFPATSIIAPQWQYPQVNYGDIGGAISVLTAAAQLQQQHLRLLSQQMLMNAQQTNVLDRIVGQNNSQPVISDHNRNENTNGDEKIAQKGTESP